jgi:hypothetical protein
MSDKLYCKDCRRKILSVNWQIHLSGDSQLGNANKNKENIQCAICKSCILKLNINKHYPTYNPVRPVNKTGIGKTTVAKIKKMIEDNPHLQLQEQFDANYKLITLTIRYSNSSYSSPTDYLTALNYFHRILKEAIPVKVSPSTRVVFFAWPRRSYPQYSVPSVCYFTGNVRKISCFYTGAN